METNAQPIVSTYIHVPMTARLSHAVDASNFGVSASIRVGDHGEHDAAIFFRSPEQLDRLADEAARAARTMRKALALRTQLEATGE